MARIRKDDEYWQHQCELLAEDAGHMGWSAHDYPGCPERMRKKRAEEAEKLKQIEFAFDEASRD